MDDIYYSYCYRSDTPESIYQVILIKNKYSDGSIIPVDTDTLFLNFYALLINGSQSSSLGNPLFSQRDCLEYHFVKCNLTKENFLRYTKRMYLDNYSHETASPLRKDIHDEIMQWFKSKEYIDNEILNAVTPTEQLYRSPPFIGDLFNKNLNINEVIRDAYYSLARQPKSKEDISKHYVGKINHYNSPYHYNVHDAWVMTDDWELLEIQIKDKYDPFDKLTHDEVDAALENYALGFKKGYYNFEKDILEQTFFLDKADKVKKIFDFATGRMFHSSGFPISGGEGIHPLIAWPDAGKEAGQIYRAWYLMIENYSVFTKMFEDKYKLIGNVTEATKFFNNTFDSVDPADVYAFFQQNLVFKGFLSEQTLVEYLVSAFDKQTIPAKLYTIRNRPTKQKIYSVFYDYYKNIAGKPFRKQRKYAALLGAYFEGYDTNTVSTNFNK